MLRNTNVGSDANRVIFAAWIELIERHIARLALAGLFRDSHPYDAHPTANNALLAGLSLIARAGATLARQLAGSQLHAIGMSEPVTSNSADYEALVQHLAHNGERATLRAGRREQGKHPPSNMAVCAWDFEERTRRVWREFAGSNRWELSGKYVD